MKNNKIEIKYKAIMQQYNYAISRSKRILKKLNYNIDILENYKIKIFENSRLYEYLNNFNSIEQANSNNKIITYSNIINCIKNLNSINKQVKIEYNLNL